ncbi:GNAT family N-acetyltransferase [Streptomyces sp. YIM 98790]|uniref:GNAT family N-acetyltransferase n=1 Tax=Streptomyces sp. YIM 98790 TaxID=2689077 RepID=UPI00140B9DC4|nr:GNAT family N-acetyltransferase [Streptomyces sp. YIM 98790]
MLTPPAPVPPVRLRPAAAADLPAVCALVNHYIATSHVNFRTEPQQVAEWEALWRRTAGRYPWWVAEAGGGRVAGVAYAGPYSERGAYAWTAESVVYLAPGHTGRGTGRALYQRLLATLAAQGFRTVHAGIGLPNPGSERLHRALGFRHLGTLHAVGWKHGAWRDVSHWQRDLGPAGSVPPAPVRPVAEVLAEVFPAGAEAAPAGAAPEGPA